MASAPAAAGNLLHDGLTMRRWPSIALLVAVAGCGLPRQEAPQPSVPTPVVERGLPESALSHPKTLAWVQRYCAKLAHHRATELGLAPTRPLVPRVRAILVAQGLPPELSAVPAVESHYRPTARGHHGELGLWQLRPGTARRFGLQVSKARDERIQIDPSTRAAARYLSFLHARYDDWPLALAAYNAGPTRVDRALARRPGASFWDLAERRALPAISRDYVPKVLAVVRLNSVPGACDTAVTRAVPKKSDTPDVPDPT